MISDVWKEDVTGTQRPPNLFYKLLDVIHQWWLEGEGEANGAPDVVVASRYSRLVMPGRRT